MPDHEVEIFEQVRHEDVKRLPSDELRFVVATIVGDLYGDLSIGEPCDPEHHVVPLQDCFKVKFDEKGYYKAGEQPPRHWRPDWRLIYHVADGEVVVVAVVAVEARKDLAAYRIAQSRLALRSGGGAKRRRQRP